MQKIVTHLWFDDQVEEAVELYTSIFKDAKILNRQRMNYPGEGNEGTVLAIDFELAGQVFYAINGGPGISFTPAISMYVNCETQEELDGIWDAFIESGGEPDQCGWLTDKFGVSWQIIPDDLMKLLDDKDPAKRNAVSEAMFKMMKLDQKKLRKAYDNAD